MIKKILKFKSAIRNCQKGMTYIELIVVLSIFAVMTSIVVYNYGEFQSKVDVKNLANDVALKIVEAQKASVFGLLPPAAQQTLIVSPATWKPSYGIYFNTTLDNKSFIYFADANSNNLYQDTGCSGECIEQTTITKGNSISRLDVFYQGDSTPHQFNDLTVTYVRPSLGANIRSSSSFASAINYVQATVTSPKGFIAQIKIFASGRIQIN